MLSTKGALINRFGFRGHLGLSLAVYKKNVNELLKVLLELGFDVNARYNEKSPTLLEFFIGAICPNYEAISFLIDHGADVNAKHSKNNMTLYEFVKSRRDTKMKKAFGI